MKKRGLQQTKSFKRIGLKIIEFINYKLRTNRLNIYDIYVMLISYFKNNQPIYD